MKKILVIFLVVIILSACGGSQTPKPQAQQGPEISEKSITETTEPLSQSNSVVDESEVEAETVLSDNSETDISSVESTTSEAATTEKDNQNPSNEKGALGIYITTVTTEVAKAYGMHVGAYIDSVDQGSAAEKAGLKHGDIITEIDGRVVTGHEDLVERLSSYKAGETVVVTIQHPLDSAEYEQKKISVTLDKASDYSSNEEASVPETIDFDFCAEYSASRMPDGIIASFSQIEERGVLITIGRFQNDTGKDVSLDIECSYGDEEGDLWGYGTSSQPLLKSGEEYIEVFDIGEEYQSFLVECYISDVPEGIYAHYNATDVQHRRNADNSIGYNVISSDPDGYNLLIRAFYVDENGGIIGYGSADIGGSDEWGWDHMEIPSMDYDSYILVWAYQYL
ncbi:MAG: PDZ domain-containing protein [Eubacteriales bacterium]|nr:PDZ domain-containing protein [Eubacteriales bacterium]